MRLAHISDPHFGTTTPQKILALSRSLLTLNPDLVALSGDITQRARNDQFIAGKQFCDGLAPLSVLAVPGNHDIPLFNIAARLFWPYRGFRQTFGKPITAKKQFGSVEVIALNSTHPYRHIQGNLAPGNLKILGEFNPEIKLRIAIFHHPLDCPKHVDKKNILKGSREAMKSLEAAQVDLVLSGHIHDPYTVTSIERYPEIKRPLVISIAGTCLSSRIRAGAPNSFTFFETLEDDTLLIATRYDLNGPEAFVPVAKTQFRKSMTRGWSLI